VHVQSRSCKRRPWYRLVCSALLMLAPCMPALAAPSLRVRAQVGLEMHAAYVGDSVSLRGVLHDDLGVAMAGRELLARLEPTGGGRPQRHTLRSDARGGFAATWPALANTYRVWVDFEGDGFYERATASTQIEPNRAELRLDVLEPSELQLSLDRTSTRVVLRASSAAGGQALTIDVRDELGRALTRGVTDARGQLSIQLESAKLGEPGLGELIARSTGDVTRGSAEISKPILRMRETRTALHANYDPKHAVLRLIVQLKTGAGPLSQRAVGVFLDGKHLVTLVTGAAGTQRHKMTAPELTLEPGDHALVARFDSDAPGLGASRSPSVSLQIAPRVGPSAIWLLVPALCSIAFALYSLRKSRSQEPLAPSADDSASAVRLGSVTRGKTRSGYVIDGWVCDAESTAPLLASLELSAQHTPNVELQAETDGRFETASLPPALYEVCVRCAGYAALTFQLQIPHAGTGSGLRVSLRNLRGLALDAYAPLAQRLLHSESAREQSTVRETLAAAKSGKLAGPAFEALSAHVETIAYAEPTPNERDLAEVQRTAASARDELDLRRPESKDPSLEQ
jgi:hypothetical protein